jgi:deoxyribodipyrimidine photolyase-like uncharacterized protein
MTTDLLNINITNAPSHEYATNDIIVFNDDEITKENLFIYIGTKLEQKYHYLIFIILKKYNIDYTLNSNGVFVDYNKLDQSIVNEICKYLNMYIKNDNLSIQQENDTKQNELKTKTHEAKLIFNVELNEHEVDHFVKIKRGLADLTDKKLYVTKNKVIRRRCMNNKYDSENISFIGLLTPEPYSCTYK